MKCTINKDCLMRRMRLLQNILLFTCLAGAVLAFSPKAQCATAPTYGGLRTVTVNGKTYFTNKVTSTAVKTVTPSEDIASIQAKLDGAGVIRFGAGTYNLGTLKINKSNTRVEIHPDAVFSMSATFLFDIRPASGTAPISNVEIASAHASTRFLIITNGNRGGDKRPIRLANVTNFAISGVNIRGSFAGQPYIVAVPAQDGQSGGSIVNGVPVYNTSFKLVPSGGVIQNVGATGIHSGYATIQLFGGDNMLLRNVDGENGVTVRLEPGSGQDTDEISKAGPDFGAIHDVVLMDIRNSKGFCAVYLKPHAKINKNITLSNISAKDSGYALHVDSADFALDDPLRKRGSFVNTKLTGNITLTQSPGVGKTGIFAFSDLLYVDFAKRDGGGEWTDYALDPSQRLRVTTPIIPVLMLSHEFRSSVGPSTRGRFTVDVTGATIKSVGFSHSLATNGILYREDARTKLTNKRLTDAQIIK